MNKYQDELNDKVSNELGIGAEDGNTIILHRDYEKLIPEIDIDKEYLPVGFEYTLIKHNKDTGENTFIYSPDFDDADEPEVGESVEITFNGSMIRHAAPSKTEIFHHKWMMVGSDYPGFNYYNNKIRSMAWYKKLKYDPDRIMYKDYWESEVAPQINLKETTVEELKTDVVKNVLSEEMEDDKILDSLVKEFVSKEKDEDKAKALEEEIRDSFDDKGRYGDRGDSGSFTADGVEYNWIVNEEEAVRIAEEYVEEMLNDEPESFTQDWLKSFITLSDTDRRITADEFADMRTEGLSDEELTVEAGVGGEYEEAEEADDSKAMETLVDDAREKLHDEYYDDVYNRLADPYDFFVEEERLYSPEDFFKQYGNNLDVADATEDAVSTDGWAHFLSIYDNNYEETNESVVYFIEDK